MPFNFLTEPETEAQTHDIEMYDDDDQALHSLLQFLYIGNYSYSSAGQNPTSLERIQLVREHTDIFMLAEKYDIPSLKHLAEMRAKEAAEKLSPDVV